jgi:hypothetical protein
MDNSISYMEIWSPKYKDNTALLAVRKIKDKNIVRFTKAKHLKGLEFYIDGATAKKYPIVSNGTINCYAVPMTELIQLGTEEEAMEEALAYEENN